MNDYQDFRPPSAPLAEAAAGPLELADRGARLGAKLLDYLTFLALLLVLGIIAGVAMPALLLTRSAGLHAIPAEPFLVLVLGLALVLGSAGLIVWNCVWLARYGQTIGKRVVRIRIVRSNGERASLGRIFALRYLPMLFLGMVPYLGVLITLVDALLIFRDSRQCLHDQFADTLVVRAG